MYTIVNVKTTAGRFKGYRLKHNAELIGTSMIYTSLGEAKLDCFKRFGVVPVRAYTGKEVAFNENDPVHAALLRIEQRQPRCNTNMIVAVDVGHYLVRRSKFGVEVPIQYRVKVGCVFARNDQEFINP